MEKNDLGHYDMKLLFTQKEQRFSAPKWQGKRNKQGQIHKHKLRIIISAHLFPKRDRGTDGQRD